MQGDPCWLATLDNKKGRFLPPFEKGMNLHNEVTYFNLELI
jgi:hypothetical protein